MKTEFADLYYELDGAHKELMDLTDATGKLKLKVETIKDTLKASYLMAVYRGEITGKNDTERDAVARGLFAPQYEALADAERTAVQAAVERDVAKINVDRLLVLLRVWELEVAYAGLNK
jgi:hypothetical protein